MKFVCKITLFVFLVSCQNDNSENKLKFIDTYTCLELMHTDDTYGEWGGDTDIIWVYTSGTDYFANYRRYLGSNQPPPPPPPPKENEKPKKWYDYQKLEIRKDSIQLNKHTEKLVEEAIFELFKNKIKNTQGFSHSGISNSVVLGDSTFIIYDYPSIEWQKFHELKNMLMGEEN